MSHVTGSYNPLRGYSLFADNNSYRATVSLTSIGEPHASVYVSHKHTGDSFESELSKEDITDFLSLNLTHDFINHALTFYQQ